jgi:hypothetical protein
VSDAYVTLVPVEPVTAVQASEQNAPGVPQARGGTTAGSYVVERREQVDPGALRTGVAASGSGARPVTPSEVELQVFGQDVTVTWNQVPGGADLYYVVYWSTAQFFNRNTWNRIALPPGQGTFIHVGRAPGSYYYAVSAANTNGEGPVSRVAGPIVVAPPALAAPKQMVLQRGAITCGLWWEEVAGATGYAAYSDVVAHPLDGQGNLQTPYPTRTVFTRPPVVITRAHAGDALYLRMSTLDGATEGPLTVSEASST